MRYVTMHRHLSLTLTVGALLGATLLGGCRASRIAGAREAVQQATGAPGVRPIGHLLQRDYDSPEAAVTDMRSALEANDQLRFVEVFGPNWRGLASADPAERDRQRLAFLARLDGSEVERIEGGAILLVGRADDPDRFPFAVPLVERNGRWSWDTDAGVREVKVRLVGRNELDTIEALQTIAAAQLAFRQRDPDGDGKPNYASRLGGGADALRRIDGPASTWLIGPALAAADMTPNPTGAAAEGTKPFHGYRYVMLDTQGAGAPGGARDYRDASGRLADGYAVLAYPDEYRVTGVTCFLLGSDGSVYERDLGDGTDAAPRTITAFDPTGWTKVE